MSDSPKFFIHREKGFVHLYSFAGKKKWEAEVFIKLFNYAIPRFRFQMSASKTDGCWGSFIKVYRDGQKFGGINLRTGKFFVDTKRGLREGINELIAAAEPHFSLEATNITYDYIEICARFPQNLFPKAVGIMRKFKKNYRTAQTVMISKEHDTINGISECLLNDVLFSEYTLNLKIYRLYEYNQDRRFNFKRIRGESDMRSPKFEIQMSNPHRFENALKEIIPIMEAFFKVLKCEPISMLWEEDYQLVGCSGEYEKGSQEIVRRISGNNNRYTPMLYGGVLPERIEKRRNMILRLLSKKPRSMSEIIKETKASRGTIKADLEWLKGKDLVEIRGRCGIGNYYALKLSGGRDNISAPACINTNSRESVGEPRTL